VEIGDGSFFMIPEIPAVATVRVGTVPASSEIGCLLIRSRSVFYHGVVLVCAKDKAQSGAVALCPVFAIIVIDVQVTKGRAERE
jgi:hypothetical protein